jgi:UDP-N-acetylmuramoyl-tripeptide--D-alanyl-D-alanine ligase
MAVASLIFLTAAHTFLVWRRTLAYLRYFQQEGYEHIRFLKWAGLRSFTDPAFWLSIGSVFAFVRAPLTIILVFGIGAVAFGVLQPDPRRSGKIPLRLTWRAKRVLLMTVFLASVLWLALLQAYLGVQLRAVFVASAYVFASFPLLMVAANAVLKPYEASIQRAYERDALDRVKAVAPLIVGITGSYGKSSTKAILAHILQFQGPTLAATGSINTLMGVTRHIRENLVYGHRFMVVEMGAFKIGSIQRLCALTPPSAGIITAVGDMHLERFGSLDAIVQAKGELARALPDGGLLAVNADSPGALRIAREARHCRVLLYGEASTEPDLATRLEQVQFTKRGTTFTLAMNGRTHQCFTPLLGRPIIQNIAGAATLAIALGVDPEVVVAALRTLKPVSNRLEVSEDKGITWIRDAYNSNQFGFRAALEVAAALPAVRRFLATPGVIELGREQAAVNRALAREAAVVCDATIVVSETNRDAFAAGHREAGHPDRLVLVDTRAEAFEWLRRTVKDGDAVILENDLPDLYERSAGLFWKERR